MDGENNGKPLLLKWMIWGYHYFWKHPYSKRNWSMFWRRAPHSGWDDWDTSFFATVKNETLFGVLSDWDPSGLFPVKNNKASLEEIRIFQWPKNHVYFWCLIWCHWSSSHQTPTFVIPPLDPNLPPLDPNLRHKKTVSASSLVRISRQRIGKLDFPTTRAQSGPKNDRCKWSDVFGP